MDPRTQLVVVTGKGGVGKTVLTAAVGRILAGRGRTVLLLEADPRENLHHLFGTDPSGGAVVAAAPGIALQNVSPRAIMDAVVRHALRVGALSRRVLGSPIYQHFAEAAPGLKEMMLLGYALQVVEGDADHRSDVVVLDAPASGHGLSLLAAPLLVSDVIGTGPIGAMASRIARHVADPATCAIVLVTVAEEMPIQETLETAAELRQRLGREPTLVVANQVWPALDPSPGAAALPDARDAVALWETRRRLNERELERLAAQWSGPTAQVPLSGAEFGPDLLVAVADALAPQLPGADGASAPPTRKGTRRA